MVASEALARTKIDPFLSVQASQSRFKAISINKSSEGSPSVEVFIKSADLDATRASVSAGGGSVHTASGTIITASIPADAIESVAAGDEVIFVEAAKPITTRTDVAGEEIGTLEVHSGLNLPQAFTGKGIIVGIVDTGVDYRHEDFVDENGDTRVLAIWDQSKTGGRGPSEIQNTYGTECSTDSIFDSTCPLTDLDGHGTHVAGIAAGSDETYMGVAPDANIIVVKYDARLDLESGYAETIFSTKICEAAYYVFAKAEQYGMPAVVNLSLGTHIGAHDGTSLFEECLSSLIEGSAGRALVAAAGNEYSGDWAFTGIHSSFDLSDQPQASNFQVRNATPDGIYYVDVWGTVDGSLEVGLAINEGEPSNDPLDFSDYASPGSSISGSFLDGKVVYMINASETRSALNDKPHVGVRIAIDPTVDVSSYSFDLVVKGSGSMNAWLFPDKPARTIQFTSISGIRSDGSWNFIPGDRANSIAIPATSPNVLAIAGYASRVRWTIESLTWIFNGQQLGDLLNFSSSGPTSDPAYTGHKPDLAAPGGMIASTKSSMANVGSQVLLEDGEHFLQSGTSMAAPFVSGAIALMFEANPNFTQDDLRSILIQSAHSDEFAPATADDRWGHGKLNVLDALALAVTTAPSGAFDANGSLSVPSQSASSGKSSCQLAVSGNHALCAIDLALLACFILCLLAGKGSRRALERPLTP